MARTNSLRSILCALLVVACANVDPSLDLELEPGLASEDVRIPGDWDPPESVRTVSDPQYVPVVEPPHIAPDGYCPSPGVFTTCVHPACIASHAGTTEIANYIFGRWSFAHNSGTYGCRRNSNPRSRDELSVHAIGRAIDIGLPMDGGDADNTLGDEIANYLITHAEHIGVQRVIWDGIYWNGSRRNRHFTEMCDTVAECDGTVPDHHTNHIHLEVSVAAGDRDTEFFRSGPPGETCPVVCYGNAAVAEDCTFVDCASMGQVCMPGPVRCETPPDPELPTATLNAGAALPTVVSRGALSRIDLVTPTRLFDTRTTTAITPEAPLTLPVISDLPSGTTAVWMNVAAIPESAPGFIVVHPSGPAPGVSSVNFAPGRVRANGVSVPINAGGVTFTASAEVNAVADLNAAFSPGGGLGLRTAGPRRVFDSRSLDLIVANDAPLPIDLGAPPGSVGVVATVTVVQDRGTAGFLQVFPCDEDPPETSSLNFEANTVTANTVISGVSRNDLGQTLVCVLPSTPVHVVVDVTAVLVPDGELSFQPLEAARLLDTRDETSLYSGRLGYSQVIEIPIASIPGIPADTRAVTVNLATISPGERGFVVAYPCDLPSVPDTSSLNFDSDNPVAAISISRVSADGRLCIYSNARTFLVVDLLGAWVPTPASPPPTDAGGASYLPEDPIAGRGVDGHDEESEMERGIDLTGEPGTTPDRTEDDGDWVPYGGDGSDGGGGPPGRGGGGCSAGSGEDSPWALGLLVVIGAVAGRRRR